MTPTNRRLLHHHQHSGWEVKGADLIRKQKMGVKYILTGCVFILSDCSVLSARKDGESVNSRKSSERFDPADGDTFTSVRQFVVHFQPSTPQYFALFTPKWSTLLPFFHPFPVFPSFVHPSASLADLPRGPRHGGRSVTGLKKKKHSSTKVQ